MTWVRLDDSVTTHAKAAAAGAEPFTLWVGGLAYANRHATDGVIPAGTLRLLFPAMGWSEFKCAGLAARLVAARLWHPREGGGWLIHDYDQYQEEALRSNQLARREANRERKRSQRERERGGISAGNATRHAVTPRDESRPVTSVSQAPVPSRPVPSRSLSYESEGEARAPRHAKQPMPVRPFDEKCREVQLALRAAHKATRGDVMPPAFGGEPTMQRDMAAIATWLLANPSVDLEAMCARWARKRDREGKWASLGWLSRDPTEFCQEPRSESVVQLTPDQEQASIDDFIRAGGGV